MSTVVTLPYLVPGEGRVNAGSWHYRIGGEWAELPDRLPAWDYATVLKLRRRVAVTLEEIVSDCVLGEGVQVGLGVTWRSSATNRRSTIAPEILKGSEVTLEFSLAGEELGGVLHLRTELLLMRSGKSPSPLAATRPASILWSHSQSIHLEGEAALFPVESVDFERAGIGPKNAAWYLELDATSLEAAALGTVRLLINTGHERVGRAAGAPNEDAESRAIVSAMRCDVMRQLVEAALDADELDDQLEYPAESLGATLRGVLRVAFPGERIGAIRSMRRSYRAEFEARIQAVSQLFIS